MSSTLTTNFENATYAKVTRRLLPLLFFCFVASYLDRVNVGFAKLQMLTDLQFSETVYGLGAGIFFLGYFLFEIPSNIILHKVGARLWIARIMITWGVISGAMIFVNSPITFYVMRFLLGIAEAGFFPGVILYLTYWYPAQRRGKIVAIFLSAVCFSGVIGGPLSGWIMQAMPGVAGFSGWQWMFIIEAIPSLVLGMVVIFYLQDRVQDAKWLSEAEKAVITNNIQSESASKNVISFYQMLTHPLIWLLTIIYFSFVMGLYGIGFWMPTIIKSTGVASLLDIGLLSAIPYAIATIAMILIGKSADYHRERRWHIVIPALLASMGLLLSTIYGGNTWIAMSALTLATSGILTVLALFWSLPTAILKGVAAAAGIALINSFGNLAGFISPNLIGGLKEITHNMEFGMVMLSVSLVVGALLTLMLPKEMVNR
jgi:D-galactonate transporter